MKNILKYFDSYFRFTKSHDLRNKLLFQRPWSELEDWESMKAAYNVRWGRAAIDEWLDYLPTVSLPIDYIEEAEKRKALKLQEMNGEKSWGLEIGIRYFPEKEAFPPVFINDLFLVSKEVAQRYLVRQRDKFKFLHLFEIILSGNAAIFEKKHKKMYKHWLFTSLEEEALIRMYEERGISWSDIETLEKSSNFSELLKYGSQTDAKMVNIKRKTNRYMRWQLLKLCREGRMINKVSKVNTFIIFNKWVIDLISGKFKI